MAIKPAAKVAGGAAQHRQLATGPLMLLGNTAVDARCEDRSGPALPLLSGRIWH